MKLSEFLNLVEQELDEIVKKEGADMLPADPDIIFSVGKPTDNKLLEPHGIGVAGTPAGKKAFFIAFTPVNSLTAKLKAMMRETMGEEEANKIFAKVDAVVEEIKAKENA